MAADAMVVYDDFKIYLGSGSIDMDADTFKQGLYLSTSNAGTRGLATGVKADLTNEHAAANGYTQGGQTLASVTWTEAAAGTARFDAADFAPYESAVGGSIVARFMVTYDDTPTSPLDPLVGFVLMDNAPADIIVTDTNDLNYTFAATGIFELSGAET